MDRLRGLLWAEAARVRAAAAKAENGHAHGRVVPLLRGARKPD